MARGWWPASRVELLLLASVAALVAIAFALMVTSSVRPRVQNWIAERAGKLTLLAVAVWGSLAVMELTLHTVGRSWWIEPANVRSPGLRIVFHPRSDIMPGVSGDAHYRTNRDGLRGPEMAPDIPPRAGSQGIVGQRIVCLGGSTTECTYLDDAETWPALVAQHLNAEAVVGEGPGNWVGAAAVSGASTREHLRFVETSALMDEIDMLIVLCGVNDLELALRGTDAAQQPSPPWLWSQLAIAKLIVRSWSRWTAATRMAAEDPEGRNYLARRAERAGAKISNETPSLASAIGAYRERLKRIAEICRQRDVRLVLVEQPVLWREELPDDAARLLWLGGLPMGHYLSAGNLRLAMDEFNRALHSVASAMGVTFVDTGSLAGRPELFYDDCHLNERGAQELAALVAAALELEASPAASVLPAAGR